MSQGNVNGTRLLLSQKYQQISWDYDTKISHLDYKTSRDLILTIARSVCVSLPHMLLLSTDMLILKHVIIHTNKYHFCMWRKGHKRLFVDCFRFWLPSRTTVFIIYEMLLNVVELPIKTSMHQLRSSTPYTIHKCS